MSLENVTSLPLPAPTLGPVAADGPLAVGVCAVGATEKPTSAAAKRLAGPRVRFNESADMETLLIRGTPCGHTIADVRGAGSQISSGTILEGHRFPLSVHARRLEARRLAAVDWNRRAGDEGRLIRAQPENGRGDLVDV